MRIILTGTPGTGKTKIAPIIAKALSLELIGLKEFVNRHHLYTMEGKEKAVHVKKLRKMLLHELKGRNNYIVESHLTCEFRIPADIIVVLRTHPKILRKRLGQRKYTKRKLEENLFAEMLDYCVQRVEAIYCKHPLELDTSQTTPEAAAKKLIAAIKKKRKTLDRLDYSKELKRVLRLKE
jgi:adenylate kinase